MVVIDAGVGVASTRIELGVWFKGDGLSGDEWWKHLYFVSLHVY